MNSGRRVGLCVAMAMCAVAIYAPTAFAADRMVLGEYFKATW